MAHLADLRQGRDRMSVILVWPGIGGPVTLAHNSGQFI
jgi:hypothetical protein